LTLIATLEAERALGAGTARAQLFAARIHACRPVAAGSFELEGCAGAAVGLAAARGQGYDDDMQSIMGWVAPLVRAGLRYPQTGTVSLRLTLAGMINLVRPRLVQRGRAEHAATAGALGGAAGLELLIAIR
jgi:hypothetical protein